MNDPPRTPGETEEMTNRRGAHGRHRDPATIRLHTDRHTATEKRHRARMPKPPNTDTAIKNRNNEPTGETMAMNAIDAGNARQSGLEAFLMGGRPGPHGW